MGTRHGMVFQIRDGVTDGGMGLQVVGGVPDRKDGVFPSGLALFPNMDATSVPHLATPIPALHLAGMGHFQCLFQSHLAWVQSHFMCCTLHENSIFHLAWKISQNSREATPFPSIRYSTSQQQGENNL